MVFSMSGRTAASVCPSYGLPGSAFTWATNWPPLQRFEGRRHAHLDAELVGLVGLAFADALNLGSMQRVELPATLALALILDPASPRERQREHLCEFRSADDLAGDVADDAPQHGADAPQGSGGTLELLGVGIALVPDQRDLADPHVDWRRLTPVAWARRTRRSRARCISLASVGKAIAFSCTVVSMTTCRKSAGLAAPMRVATARLSWISATSLSSPMRWRQRVSDERSNGS